MNTASMKNDIFKVRFVEVINSKEGPEKYIIRENEGIYTLSYVTPKVFRDLAIFHDLDSAIRFYKSEYNCKRVKEVKHAWIYVILDFFKKHPIRNF